MAERMVGGLLLMVEIITVATKFSKTEQSQFDKLPAVRQDDCQQGKLLAPHGDQN